MSNCYRSNLVRLEIIVKFITLFVFEAIYIALKYLLLTKKTWQDNTYVHEDHVFYQYDPSI